MDEHRNVSENASPNPPPLANLDQLEFVVEICLTEPKTHPKTRPNKWLACNDMPNLC